MAQAIDEKSGQFDKDGFERSYSLELLDTNGNSLKKIFWDDLAPVITCSTLSGGESACTPAGCRWTLGWAQREEASA